MIITIDGPAGAGKSTVARLLARRLGFRFLNSGAMYRAVALAALQRNIDLANEQEMADLCRQLTITWDDNRLLLNGDDVTEAIRSSRVSAVAPAIADHAQVREHLGDLQRQLAADQDVVTEGRDQGTVVFPRAELKFFLVASPEERARRRYNELRSIGEDVTYQEVLEQVQSRDRHDMNRPVGRLQRPEDAVDIETDGLTVQQVVDRLETVARAKITAA